MIRRRGANRTAANFQLIKTRIKNAVPNVTIIRIIEVEASLITSSN